jgi:hypothetical protein
VHRIVLFDPGNTGDFVGGCDTRFNVNALLANWLRSNSSNRLVVLTGCNSEEHPYPRCLGRSTFQGLWKYYFAGIWNQSFAGQALVCDYNKLGHSAVLQDFSWIVKSLQSGCPTAAGAPKPISWNP